MPPRLICALCALTPISLLAQDPALAHAGDDNTAMSAAKAAAPALNPAQAKGRGGRGAANGVAANPGGGGGGRRGGNPAELLVDLNKIIADPAGRAKGRKLFGRQCMVWHGAPGD